MTLELNKVTQQVARLGEQAAQRKHVLEALTPQVREILHDHRDDAALIDLARRATETKHWRGAVPIGEPLDSAIDPPPHPARLSIVAGDGSQIYPDAHGIALYYVINIGTIVFRHGSGQAPIVSTFPTVSSEVESADDEIISGPVVNARRDVGELTHIADLALAESAATPTVALMDGTLALWVQTAAIPQDEQDRVQRDYVQQLDRLRAARLPIGAFLSRPRSTNLTQLAHLTTFGEDADRALSSVMNERGPAFKGLRDTTVLATMLKPGQRSALFEVAPAWNTSYRDRGHSIHFFYINVGTLTQPELARIEVPVWIAQDRSAVGVLHAALVEQCKVSQGYPYVLARAHEIAVVTNTERAEFDRMIATQLTRQGVEAKLSEKQFQKSLLATKRH